MQAQYTKSQIQKFIEPLPVNQQKEILEKMEKGNNNYDFAKAYGLDPKQFSRAEIELGFGQVI
jgi:hypothetical protein